MTSLDINSKLKIILQNTEFISYYLLYCGGKSNAIQIPLT